MKPYTKLAAILCAICLLAGCASAGSDVAPQSDGLLDPANPTTINIWNYYNGDQLAAFETLVSEFNDTVGTEKGIVAVSTSQGSIDTLADALLEAVNGNIGAQEIPTLAAVYSETAYILEQKDALVDLDAYFSANELAQYVPGFIEEGRLTPDGPLLL